MAFKKTTADMPSNEASEFAKVRRPEAIAEAEGDGYTTTKSMQKGMQSPSQFGLPKSPGKKPPMKMGKGKPMITPLKDTDKDRM